MLDWSHLKLLVLGLNVSYGADMNLGSRVCTRVSLKLGLFNPYRAWAQAR